MPEYNYKCSQCDTEFSIVKSMLDVVTVYCPKCCTQKVKRIFGNVSVIYKGDGFYNTDSKKTLTLEE